MTVGTQTLLTLILIFGAIIAFILWITRDEKNSSSTKNVKNTKRSQTEPEVDLAVIFIETAAKFVKEHWSYLECEKITMWEIDEGYRVEFYALESFFKGSIEKALDDVFGQWKVREDTDGMLCISVDVRETYEGSWNSFNKKVWDEVKRKHPEWRIEKVYSYKYVLSV